MRVTIDDNIVSIAKFGNDSICALEFIYRGQFEGHMLKDGIVRFNDHKILFVSFTPITEGEFMQFSGSLNFTKGYYYTFDKIKQRMHIKRKTNLLKTNNNKWDLQNETWNEREFIDEHEDVAPFMGDMCIKQKFGKEDEIIYKISKNDVYVKGVDTKGLTSEQIKQLKSHSVHHTAKHLRDMVESMKRGISFEDSHLQAMRKVGR
tara:strand:+ start:216 stop:830 length:615 start_codon:yes stop_codon:yes gene_type:complete